MSELKNSDMRIIEAAFQGSPGYVLDFSDRTFREFFEDEFRIDIDAAQYSTQGGSKMNRLRHFCRIESPAVVARVLRSLAEYRDGLTAFAEDASAKTRLFRLIARLEGAGSMASTDALERFAPDQTLDELLASIERDIQADRPSAALDRLHTYCGKKFGHLLEKRDIAWDRGEPLHSRVGKYVKALQAERSLSDMTVQIIKNANGVFDKFNGLRNNHSLAHDNELIDNAEARFIFDSVSAILRFVSAIDMGRSWS